VTYDWHRPDVKSTKGGYNLKNYLSAEFQRVCRAGEVFVVGDTKADPRTDEAGYATIDVRAFVTVPIVREGNWRFLVGMYDSSARVWRDDEIALMRELAARIWTRVERARTEEALRQSEAQLRAVFESARDYALITMDVEGLITAWNPGAEAIFGSSVAEMIGQDARELLSSEERAARMLDEEMTLADRTGRAGDDHWMQRRDGRRFWASGLLMPLRVAGLPPHGFLKILRDMTGVYETEQARRQAEDRFALVVQSIEDYAIYMLDAEGRITTWNQGAERIKGYTPQEAIGQPFGFCFTPEAIEAGKPAEELAIAAREGRFQEEAWRMRQDGSRYWGDELVVALRDASGELIAFAKFCRDLTERKRHEDERTQLLAAERAARAEAEAASKAKDHFLAVLSHELRTPLTPVLMAVHLLGRNRNLPASARDALEMIARNVQIEAHLIDDLLDLTKITRGQLEIVRVPMDLHQAVQHAVEITAADLEGRGQQLTVKLEAAEHALSGDTTRLQQAFWNLLKNASKFTSEGGAIHITSRNEPERIIVEITDTGIGFEAEAVTRIFDAFTQANSEVMQKFGGLGLGLAITKATVEAHGGILSAWSEGLGQGATFTVGLPLAAGGGNQR
jgi:PAS domain S-box-containing protein